MHNIRTYYLKYSYVGTKLSRAPSSHIFAGEYTRTVCERDTKDSKEIGISGFICTVRYMYHF